ncbi:MAG TPA: hypothetical protein VFG64_00215 [Dongiaceae bacterium]|jgi:hypothetical protein|nr:hypothetical protein [Dongiaceae bacterium]
MLLALLLTSCAHAQDGDQDQTVTVSLANAGTRPLRCHVMFGHWVDRDLGELAPGAATKLTMTQAAEDGALYVMRSDGERKMMIETIQCAESGNWRESFGQVDLAPVRSRRARAIEASCAAPAGGGRVGCRLDRIE